LVQVRPLAEGKKHELEEVNLKTKEAVDYLSLHESEFACQLIGDRMVGVRTRSALLTERRTDFGGRAGSSRWLP